MTAPPTTVVYVLGTARSGSTLLTRLIAEDDPANVFAAGEIRLLWSELEHRVCGCGQPAVACPVWSRVVGDPTTRAARARVITGLMHHHARMQDLPRILRAGGDPDRLPDQTRRYAQQLGATYQRIANVTGASVIVDSSKSVADAALLHCLPNLDPVIVHVVRDPRAVAWSWERAVREGARGTPGHPRWSVALRWLLTNAASEAVVGGCPSGYRLRYEDIARAPRQHLAGLHDRLVSPGDASGDERAPAAANTRHIVGGNRLRRSDTPVQVRADDDWQLRMPRAATAEVAALTFPLRHRYHYAWRSPS